MIELETIHGKAGDLDIDPMATQQVADVAPAKKKRKSGIPTGNAGEYFVMGELLRRGYDAQLADRNTAAYDVLVGRPEDQHLQKVQVKSVRAQPWFVRPSSFQGELLDQTTIYVLIGKAEASDSVRYFIVRNRDVAGEIAVPATWTKNDSAFITLKSLRTFEDCWDTILAE
jgi:hypothetical protein